VHRHCGRSCIKAAAPSDDGGSTSEGLCARELAAWSRSDDALKRIAKAAFRHHKSVTAAETWAARRSACPVFDKIEPACTSAGLLIAASGDRAVA